MARRWLATGVIPSYLNSMVPSADGSALAVVVATGGAWIEGFYYETDAPLTVTLSAAHATLARIDRIVVRLDRTANTIVVDKLTGTAASSPSAPALTQTDTLWEMVLADVAVPAAAGVVTAGNVTDRRALTGDARLILRSQFDAKGDLLVGTADDTFTRKAVGANDTVLTADSTQAGGVKWAAPPGSVLGAAAVVPAESTSSGTVVDLTTAGPAVTFTVPASGKILVRVSCHMLGGAYNAQGHMMAQIGGGSAALSDITDLMIYLPTSSGDASGSRESIVTGLTPGASLTVTAKYGGVGGSVAFSDRVLSVLAV